MDLSASARAFVLFVSFAATLLPAQGGNKTDEPSRTAAGWSERYGMVLPRPVDAAQREALGNPAPREATVILAELEEAGYAGERLSTLLRVQ